MHPIMLCKENKMLPPVYIIYEVHYEPVYTGSYHIGMPKLKKGCAKFGGEQLKCSVYLPLLGAAHQTACIF